MTVVGEDWAVRFRREGADGRIALLKEAHDRPGTPEGLALYEEAMGDAEWRVRKMAVECVLALADKEKLVGWLIELLRCGDNAGKRNSAIEALELIGQPAIPELLAHARDPDVDVRKFIVDILGMIRDFRSFDTLVALLDDPDGNVSAAAAESLGNLGLEKAAVPLLGHLGTGDLNLDYVILEALGRIGGEIPLEAIRSILGNPILKKVAYGVLGVVSDPSSVDLLLEGLGERSRSARDAAIGALVRRYDACADGAIREGIRARVRQGLKLPTIRELARMMDRMETPQRKAIAKLLGWSGRSEATSAILALADEPPLREVVLEALDSLGETAVAELAAAFSEAGFSVQALICEALGKVAGLGSERLLLEALESESPDVREMAALGLAGQSRGAIGPLFRVFLDEERRVQWAAVRALERLAERFRREVLGGLQEALSSSEVALRKNGIALAGRVAGSEDFEAIACAVKDESSEVRRFAVAALANLEHPDRLDRILLCVADENDDVRVAVAVALGRFRSNQALDSLLLLTGDENLRVRTSAIRSLADLGDRRALVHLYPLLAHEAGIVSISALEAVLALDPDPARDRLDLILGHREPEVVAGAVGLLSAIRSEDFVELTGGLLEHPDSGVRIRAVEALAEKRAGGAWEAIAKHVASEKDPEVAGKMRAILAKRPAGW